MSKPANPGIHTSQSVTDGTHQDTEGKPVTIAIPDHPARSESADFRAAKKVAKRILGTLAVPPYGGGPWQQHHAGSLWTLDADGWFLVLNTLGSEWSAQWCGDPARYDGLRQTAQRHYGGFPLTVPALIHLGYTDASVILEEPIVDAAGIARWTDSIYNSCVPLAAGVHTGTRWTTGGEAGWHVIPKPIWDIQFTRRLDFRLFVTDESGHSLAVTPVAPRGSGDGRVEVQWAHPSSVYAGQHQSAHAQRQRVILPADHPAASQAFAEQT